MWLRLPLRKPPPPPPHTHNPLLPLQWPINEDPDNGLTDAASVFAFAKSSGYDGLELTVDDWRRRFFRGRASAEIVREVRALSASTGIAIVGSLYHVSDGDWRREHDDDGAEGKLWDLDWADSNFDAKVGGPLQGPSARSLSPRTPTLLYAAFIIASDQVT